MSKTPIFEDRKKDDKISQEHYDSLIKKAKADKKNKGKLNNILKILKNTSDQEPGDALTQEYNQLNIETVSHSVLFILFLSLLIGLSLNTLLSFVFPIYTESSFKDHIPGDLNIHGFKIGTAYFDGVVRVINQTRYVNIEIPEGLTIDLETGSNSYYVSATNTILFSNSEEYQNTPSFLSMETQYIQSDALKLDDRTFKFGGKELIVSDSFDVMGRINCKSLIYDGYIFYNDGNCGKASKTNAILLEDSSENNMQSFLKDLKSTDNFGLVNNFSVNYPYIAVIDDNEMRIYKYENEDQFLIGKVKGKGNLYKNSNSNSFIFGQNLYHVVNEKIKKIDNINDIDYENETIDNDGNKLIILYNETGIYYIQCDGIDCNQRKSLLLYDFISNNKKIMNPFDLKISFDQFGSPVVTSNSLRTLFLIDQENNSFETIFLDFDDDNIIDDIRMLTYSNQLLYLSNHTISRYLI